MIVNRSDINKVALAIRKFASSQVNFKGNIVNDDYNFIMKFDCKNPITESFAVDGLLFINIISKCDGEIEIELKDNKLYLKNRNSKFSMPLLEYKEFEFLNVKINYIDLGKTDFEIAIKKVIFACAKNDNKATLVGVNVTLDNSTLKTIGLDGYRLAICKQNVIAKNTDKFNLTIPSSDLNGIFELLDSESIKFGWNETSVFIKESDILIRLPLINGTYPDVSSIVDKISGTIVKINRSKLIDATKLTMFNDDKFVKLIIKGNKCLVKNRSSYYETETELTCENPSNVDLSICFQSQYLLDLCFHTENDDIEFELSQTNRPIKVSETLTTQILVPIKEN